ncbi:TRAP transporter small permease subunit [Alcaligenes sp. Marseille-Q7550]
MITFRAWLDALNERIGRLVSLSMLLILAIAFTVVVLRYLFGIGLIWLQDSYVWLTSLFFIGLSGSALLHDRHVRVELFYSRMRRRRQALVNALGVVLLLWPTLLVITLTSSKPISRSWQFLEASPNTGGLPFAYVHKSLIYVFCALLFIQGLSLLLSSLAALPDRREPAAGAQP